MKNMIRKLVLTLAPIFLFALAANARQDFRLDSMKATDLEFFSSQKGTLNKANLQPKSKVQKTKDWTIMVFMNAKNDLSEGHLFGLVGKWAKKDLKEMKKVGTTDKVNIVVEIGEKGKGSRRILVKKKSGFFSSGEVVYQKDPNADMGDYKRVIDFIKWAKKEFPAKKTMLVLWNHGLGWIDPNLNMINAGTGTSSKGILFDDDTKNYVKTKQLGEILRQTGYVDVFVMNACLMQMAEVGFEIKDYTGLLVGSEETMLAFGFDYEKLLKFINANTNASNIQISEFFINWYKDFFSSGVSAGPINVPLDSIAATLSTINPKAFGKLPPLLNGLAKAAMDNREEEAVKCAIQNAIRFTSLDPKNDKEKLLSSYTDLYDFVRLLGQKALNPQTAQAAERLMEFIKSELVIRSIGLNKDATNGYDYSKVGGIAIETTRKIKKDISNQLNQLFETNYSDLSLSKASLWDEFVQWSNKVWLK